MGSKQKNPKPLATVSQEYAILNPYISQGSGATHLRHDGNFSDHFIYFLYSLLNPTMTELCKLVCISQKFSDTCFSMHGSWWLDSLHRPITTTTFNKY